MRAPYKSQKRDPLTQWEKLVRKFRRFNFFFSPVPNAMPNLSKHPVRKSCEHLFSALFPMPNLSKHSVHKSQTIWPPWELKWV